MLRFHLSLLLSTANLFATSLYDAAPVTPENPVLVHSADRALTITRAELAAYQTALGQDPATAAPAVRAAALEALIDERLILAAALAAGLDRDPEVLDRAGLTRRIVMQDRLGRLLAAEFPAEPDANARLRRLGQKLFTAADILVNRATYEATVAEAARLDAATALAEADAAAGAPASRPQLQATASLAARLLARHEATGRNVSVGEFLETYLARPFALRGDLSQPAVFEAALEPLFAEPLLAQEADRRQLADDPAVVAEAQRVIHHYLIALLRERATMQRAGAELRALPAAELSARLQALYARLAPTRYTDTRTGRVLPFAEVEESLRADLWSERVETLQAEFLSTLRAGTALIRLAP